MLLNDAMEEGRLLVLDGAMGSVIQRCGLTDADYRGDVFTGDVRGNNECLNLTRPDVIADIHRQYVLAGADIISTNSFGANAIAQKAFGLSDYAPRMAGAAARIARQVADSFSSPAGAGAPVSPGQALPLRGPLPLEPRAASLPNRDTLPPASHASDSSGRPGGTGPDDRLASLDPTTGCAGGSPSYDAEGGTGPCDPSRQLSPRAASLPNRDTLSPATAEALGKRILVAGSVGPTGKSLTLPSGDDCALREYDFDDFVAAYSDQFAALIEGGVDFILLETCFDALNAKAAIYALEQLGNPVPMVISATVSDRSGRTLTGQTLEAFYHSVSHCKVLAAFGVNCALGAAQMAPLVEEIASFSRHPLIFYPNAGIPDAEGRYNDSPEHFASVLSGLACRGLLNIAGGCCGTTPEHIRALADALSPAAAGAPASSGQALPLRGPLPLEPRAASLPNRDTLSPAVAGAGHLTVAGLEAVEIAPERNFTNIGERTNVAGSRKFARLIASGDYGEALRVAAAQIDGGAPIIDINMDDAMLDSRVQMRTFLRYVNSDPAVSRAAVMIDSSHWETVVEGLKNVQGRPVVNSISLKEGEAEFVRKALYIRSMGGAMVVMAFDEAGQAETFGRKVEICARSYNLLVGAGIPPSDIVFDVNVLSVGTGIAEHSRFGVDFIDAVRWIKSNLPGALTSGGISNLSFAFRGNNAVREAMHSAFLYHAIKAGLDMAIVNPQMLRVYEDIEPELLKAVEDVIFDSDSEATSRLVSLAAGYSERVESTAAAGSVSAAGADDGRSAADRLSDALVKGDESTLAADVLSCLNDLGRPVDVVEGPLMRGMERVGTLFADGRMFLPQVVKSAKVMKDAVAVLEPYIREDDGSASARPKFVIATVKGDVHDIGKNITAIVLQCSGFDVVDLGVMVPCDDIIEAALREGAVAVGVSGLITPSLYRMEELCRELASRGLSLPLFVGGAAASAAHTEAKLKPLYSNVYYGSDASMTAVLAKKLLGRD